LTISFIDPPNVRHLGELASLKKAILSHFDGDSGLRFHSDEDRWQAILRHYDRTQRLLIAGQIRELLSRDDGFVLAFWDKHSDYFGFETADEVRQYLSGKLRLFEQDSLSGSSVQESEPRP
jgi:hypothetical protein